MNVRFLTILTLVLAGAVFMPLSLMAQPGNDDFADADTLIIGAPCVIGDNATATPQNVAGIMEPSSPCNSNGSFGKTLWYQIMPGTTAEEVSIKASFTSGSTIPVSLALYTWSGASPMVLDPNDFCEIVCTTVAQNKEASLDSLLLVPNQTYYLQVDGPGGEFCLEVEDLTVSPTFPPNDGPCNAIELNIGESCNGMPNGDNTNATLQCNEPRGSCYSGGDRTLWYQFVAPASGGVIITTDVAVGGTLEDTDITLYSRFNPLCALLETYTEIECDNNSGNNLQANGVITASGLFAGVTYYVQVTGGLDVSSGEDTRGTFCIEVKDLIPPNPGETACIPEPIIADGTVFQFDNFLAQKEDIDSLLELPELGLGNGTTTWKDTVIDASFWVSFIAPPTGHVLITTCNGDTGNTSFDTQLAVYYNPTDSCSDYANFELIAANDDLPGLCQISNERASQLDLSCLIPGELYYILVDGFFGQLGDFSISATPLPGASPNLSAATIPPGCSGQMDGYILTNVQEGQAPYQYDWDNGDSTAAIYNLSPGTYTLTVTDACDSVSTSSFTVGSAPFNPLSIDNMGMDATLCAQEDSFTLGGAQMVSGGSYVESDRIFVVDQVDDTLSFFRHTPVVATPDLITTREGVAVLQTLVAGDFDSTGTDMFLLTNEFTLDTNLVTIVAINRLWKLSLPNGDTSFAGRIHTPVKTRLTGLAFHPVENRFYGIGYNFQTDEGLMYRLAFAGPDSIIVENEVSLDIEFPVYLAIEEDGGFITQALNEQSVYRLDPVTGTTTLVGLLPFQTDFFSQDADIDPNTGRLYIQTYNTQSEHPDLLLYDLDTGEGFVVPGYKDLQIGGALGILENLHGYTYQWDVPAGVEIDDPTLARPKVLFTQSGAATIDLTVTDECGNEQMGSVTYSVSREMSISVEILDETATGAQDGTLVATVTEGVAPYTFTWNGSVNSPSPNEVDSLTNQAGGNFTLTIEDAYGCEAQTSGNLPTDIRQSLYDLNRFALYPNPNEGQFQLEVEMKTPTSLNASLLSPTGQQVWGKSYWNVSELKEGVNVMGLPAGVYMLRIQSAEGSLAKKVMIH